MGQSVASFNDICDRFFLKSLAGITFGTYKSIERRCFTRSTLPCNRFIIFYCIFGTNCEYSCDPLQKSQNLKHPVLRNIQARKAFTSRTSTNAGVIKLASKLALVQDNMHHPAYS
jgi:hypothetical protein